MRKDIPEFKCHKKVRAFEIGKIEGHNIFPYNESLCPPVEVSGDFIERHPLNEPGYLVIYEDGYMSYSPKDVFEAGYTELPKPGELTTKVLMSRGNKGGFKLEDLLDIVIDDIDLKTSLIKNKTGLTEQTLIQHNQVVIGHLKCAAATQRLTYIKLETDKGVNKGVDNPRV